MVFWLRGHGFTGKPHDLILSSLAILQEPSTLALLTRNTMEPKRIKDIQASLENMSMEELQEMADNLHDLIHVLYTRQVAIEDAILNRLEAAFVK